MPKKPRTSEDLTHDLFRRIDPGGELGAMVRAFGSLMRSSTGRSFLEFLGVDVREATHLANRSNQIVRDISDATLVFAPAGWAPSSQIPPGAYRTALDLYRGEQNLGSAELILVGAWNEPNRLEVFLKPLIGFGAGYKPLEETFHHRWRLVDKALRHHRAGAYEASVPIILAQIDGIVWDVTEHRVGFFWGSGQDAYLIDRETVAGLPEGLEFLRKLTSRGLKQSGATGSLVRHGILHGQELGYDTYQNSTKAFVLLLAVLDWAKPRAMTLADRLKAEDEAKHAGSNATDIHGRLLDRRGFDRAQDGLRMLMWRQMRDYERYGRYSHDLNTMFPAPGRDNDILGNKDEITLRTSEDGQIFWAWRSTPSGYYFAIALTAPKHEQAYYAGVQPPTGGPKDNPSWHSLAQPPPDWT